MRAARKMLNESVHGAERAIGSIMGNVMSGLLYMMGQEVQQRQGWTALAAVFVSDPTIIWQIVKCMIEMARMGRV